LKPQLKNIKYIGGGIDREVYSVPNSKIVHKVAKNQFVNFFEWMYYKASIGTPVENILCPITSKSKDFNTIRQKKATTNFFNEYYGFEEAIQERFLVYLHIKGGPNITDLHFANYGIYNNRLVIIDYTPPVESQKKLMELFYSLDNKNSKKQLKSIINRIHNEFLKKPNISVVIENERDVVFYVGDEKKEYRLNKVNDLCAMKA
jgi:hypothetical protein